MFAARSRTINNSPPFFRLLHDPSSSVSSKGKDDVRSVCLSGGGDITYKRCAPDSLRKWKKEKKMEEKKKRERHLP